MIALTSQEAGELRDRLRDASAAQPASETVAVSANASTSVTFTDLEKAAVLDVLTQWARDARNEISEGLRAEERTRTRPRSAPLTRAG